MKSFKVLFMIMLSAIVLIGCKKKTATDAGTDTDTTPSVTTGIDFDALSKEMCGCAGDMLANLKKMQELTAANDTEGIATVSAAMEAGNDKMETCFAALESKYPGVDGNAEYEAKAEAALQKNCPELAKALSSMGE